MNHQYSTSHPASYLHFYNNPAYSALYIIESTLSFMPRQPRKPSGTGIFHVMMRGINHQEIFCDAEDYYHFITTLDRMRAQYDDDGNPCGTNCTYYAYCLMSNHFHLLIREREETVGDTIKRIASSYVYYFNRQGCD